jgi:GNAT superfamily N-acetyltransferase
MTDEIRFLPATSCTLDALADIFTRSFENYFYSGTVTAADLARRIRIENLDLHHSLVMMIGDAPAGQALLALRGERAWCGGFGVLLPFRGRGLAHQLAITLIDQARLAGAHTFGLEVLTRNTPAIRTYTRAGLRVQRDLLMLEWRGPEGERAQGAAEMPEGVALADSGQLLEHFRALHPVPAAWQRDLPALLVGRTPQALAVVGDRVPAAYVLFHTGADRSARVVDLGARRAEHVRLLLGVLQAGHTRIISVNEPADSPFVPAFLEAGFVELDRQHEMAIEL